jgi:hypothetical protein
MRRNPSTDTAFGGEMVTTGWRNAEGLSVAMATSDGTTYPQRPEANVTCSITGEKLTCSFIAEPDSGFRCRFPPVIEECAPGDCP